MIIAQLSDLHIKVGGKLAYQKVDTVAALKAAVDHINQLNPTVEMVLITGDLGDFGYPDEYALIESLLTKLTMPILIVPGNHDSSEPLRHMMARMPQVVPFDHDHHCCARYELGDWLLLGLDSHLPGKPHGHISADQLDWLQRQLDSSEKPAIVSWHHPPIMVGIDHMDRQNLQNADEVAEVLVKYPQIKAIACGHLHRPISAMFAGIPVFIAPAHNHAVTLDLTPEAPSSFSIETPMIRLFRLVDDSLISHLSVLPAHQAGPYPFFDTSGKLID